MLSETDPDKTRKWEVCVCVMCVYVCVGGWVGGWHVRADVYVFGGCWLCHYSFETPPTVMSVCEACLFTRVLQSHMSVDNVARSSPHTTTM